MALVGFKARNHPQQLGVRGPRAEVDNRATDPTVSDKSAIEWTEATLNPWTGCTKVSPGCAHCYIPRTPPFRMAGRDFDRQGHIPLVFHIERLERMIRRRKPTMYFVNSLSDLFHEDAHDQQIADVFGAMASAPQHTFQVLTKRPERAKKLLAGAWIQNEVWELAVGTSGIEPGWPLPNVWLGVSIENRRFVHRADLLRQTPAAVRFISAEPLLGPLIYNDRSADGSYALGGFPSDLTVSGDPTIWLRHWCDEYDGEELDLTDIDWLICGGESGAEHRPIRADWVRDLRDAAQANDTAFFFKQWGGRRPKSGGRLLDGRTWDEFPRHRLLTREEIEAHG